MALGKNMKIDRLIPLKNLEDKVSVKIESEKMDNVVESISQTPYNDIETDSIKIVFTPSRRKTQKRILITIEGSLTINNVELLYSNVKGVFENYDFVEVTMINISEVDLTVVQLFHLIRVKYWSLKKYISINAGFGREDRKLLNTCGFTEFQTQKTATL